MPTAGQSGRDRTLAAARRVYYWPTMRVDIDSADHAKHKGTTKDPAPMLQYPPPECPWDVVSIDLLQLSKSFRVILAPGVCGSFLKICGSSTCQKQNSRICDTCARDSARLSTHNAKNTTER